MNKETVTTVAVIAVIGVAAYLLVKNLGGPAAPLQLATDNTPDNSLAGARSVFSSIKGWIMGSGSEIQVPTGARTADGTEVKRIVITDPSYPSG